MTDKELIIYDIQALRNLHVGTPWQEFSKIIYSACRQPWFKKDGEPMARWTKVANAYLAELKKAQEFTQIP